MWKWKVVFNHRKLASITFLKVNRKEIHSVVCSCPSFHEYHPVRRGAAMAAAAWSACRRRRLSKHRYTQWRRMVDCDSFPNSNLSHLVLMDEVWWTSIDKIDLGFQELPAATPRRGLRRRRRHAAPRHASSSYSNRGALKIFHFPPEMPRSHIQ